MEVISFIIGKTRTDLIYCVRAVNSWLHFTFNGFGTCLMLLDMFSWRLWFNFVGFVHFMLNILKGTLKGQPYTLNRTVLVWFTPMCQFNCTNSSMIVYDSKAILLLHCNKFDSMSKNDQQ